MITAEDIISNVVTMADNTVLYNWNLLTDQKLNVLTSPSKVDSWETDVLDKSLD